MKRTVIMYALFTAATAALAAQQASQSNPYQGTSNPPPDETITTTDIQPQQSPTAKPSPAHVVSAQPVAQVQQQQTVDQTAPLPSQAVPAAATNATAPSQLDGTDDGIVQVAPDTEATTEHPGLNRRVPDPDGDIVHPVPPPPGELGVGAVIRVRLLDRLSTAENKSGDRFHATVASDVIQNGQVLIPTGSRIDGTVVDVSSGQFGGHGSMRLRPQMVTLPDGSRFNLYAQTSGAPGSRTRVEGGEGVITPDSRLKKDGIEYGSAVGAGAVTGAIVGGAPGALAGTIIGASVITAHLLISHPQATLESGTVLLFTLSEPLNLVPASAQAAPPDQPGSSSPSAN